MKRESYYVPDAIRTFDGHMSPRDELENTRRANATMDDFKATMILCGGAFVLGVLVGPWIISLLARLWL